MSGARSLIKGPARTGQNTPAKRTLLGGGLNVRQNTGPATPGGPPQTARAKPLFLTTGRSSKGVPVKAKKDEEEEGEEGEDVDEDEEGEDVVIDAPVEVKPKPVLQAKRTNLPVIKKKEAVKPVAEEIEEPEPTQAQRPVIKKKEAVEPKATQVQRPVIKKKEVVKPKVQEIETPEEPTARRIEESEKPTSFQRLNKAGITLQHKKKELSNLEKAAYEILFYRLDIDYRPEDERDPQYYIHAEIDKIKNILEEWFSDDSDNIPDDLFYSEDDEEEYFLKSIKAKYSKLDKREYLLGILTQKCLSTYGSYRYCTEKIRLLEDMDVDVLNDYYNMNTVEFLKSLDRLVGTKTKTPVAAPRVKTPPVATPKAKSPPREPPAKVGLREKLNETGNDNKTLAEYLIDEINGSIERPYTDITLPHDIEDLVEDFYDNNIDVEAENVDSIINFYNSVPAKYGQEYSNYYKRIIKKTINNASNGGDVILDSLDRYSVPVLASIATRLYKDEMNKDRVAKVLNVNKVSKEFMLHDIENRLSKEDVKKIIDDGLLPEELIDANKIMEDISSMDIELIKHFFVSSLSKALYNFYALLFKCSELAYEFRDIYIRILQSQGIRQQLEQEKLDTTMRQFPTVELCNLANGYIDAIYDENEDDFRYKLKESIRERGKKK